MEFNIFIIKIYLKYWFQATIPTLAPQNDLNLLKDLSTFDSINSTISKEGLKVMERHTWYINDTMVGLSFFDRTISNLERSAMIENLNKHKVITIKTDLTTKTIADFVSSKTNQFFTTLFDENINGVSYQWLKNDIETWYSDPEYIKAEAIVKSLNVVNDLAERSIALITQYNSILCNKEDQKQFLLQVKMLYYILINN